MVSHKLKFIFVHVPKTGGQSIERALLKEVGTGTKVELDCLLCANEHPDRGPPRLDHLTAREYRDLGYVMDEQYSTYFKFGFVRNPWARLVSEFQAAGHGRRIDFKTWLMRDFPIPSWSDAYRHVMPQTEFFVDQEGQNLMDFIGRFENLEADFATIAQIIGLTSSMLPHSNASAVRLNLKQIRGEGIVRIVRRRFRQLADSHRIWKRDNYKDYYDQEAIEWVRQKYGGEIDWFGYGFDQEW